MNRNRVRAVSHQTSLRSLNVQRYTNRVCAVSHQTSLRSLNVQRYTDDCLAPRKGKHGSISVEAAKSVTHRLRSDVVLDVLRELLLVCILIVLLQESHVISDVLSEDVLTVDVGVELLALAVVAREALHSERATCRPGS